jgi:hypothetical protein
MNNTNEAELPRPAVIIAAEPLSAPNGLRSPMISPIRSSNEVSMMEPSKIVNYTMCGEEEEPATAPQLPPAPPRNAPLSIGADYAKLYKMHIEITSLKGLQPAHVLRSELAGFGGSVEEYMSHHQEETWLYTRFEYPLLFGSAHIFSNPTVFISHEGSSSMTVIQRPELRGSLLSFEFAMSERNLQVALSEAKLGVELWSRHGNQSSEENPDQFIGIALVPLEDVMSNRASRQSIGDGEVAFAVEDYFSLLPEMPDNNNSIQRKCVGHVGVRLQLNDLGPFETARSRDQQLREQLETTRAKLEEIWEECQRERRRADKLETRLLVAEFEEQMASTQDREDFDTARQNHVEQLKRTEAKLKSQEELNRECIKALEDTERAAMAETAKRVALEKENAELRSRVHDFMKNRRPAVKRMGSISSPLMKKVLLDRSNNTSMMNNSDFLNYSSTIPMSPGAKRSINRSMNGSESSISMTPPPAKTMVFDLNSSSMNDSENFNDISNMSSAPEAERLC